MHNEISTIRNDLNDIEYPVWHQLNESLGFLRSYFHKRCCEPDPIPFVSDDGEINPLIEVRKSVSDKKDSAVLFKIFENEMKPYLFSKDLEWENINNPIRMTDIKPFIDRKETEFRFSLNESENDSIKILQFEKKYPSLKFHFDWLRDFSLMHAGLILIILEQFKSSKKYRNETEIQGVPLQYVRQGKLLHFEKDPTSKTHFICYFYGEKQRVNFTMKKALIFLEDAYFNGASIVDKKDFVVASGRAKTSRAIDVFKDSNNKTNPSYNWVINENNKVWLNVPRVIV